MLFTRSSVLSRFTAAGIRFVGVGAPVAGGDVVRCGGTGGVGAAACCGGGGCGGGCMGCCCVVICCSAITEELDVLLLDLLL